MHLRPHVFLMVGLAANFPAIATLCLAAVPFVLIATLGWFRKAPRLAARPFHRVAVRLQSRQ